MQYDNVKLREILSRGLGSPSISIDSSQKALSPTKWDITIDIRDETGHYIGCSRISIDSVKKEAYYRLTFISPENQGKNWNKILHRNIRDMLNYCDIKQARARTDADLPMGGYVTVKMGFAPIQEDWDTLREALKSDVQRMERTHALKLSESAFAEEKNRMARVLENRDPRAIWLIARSPLGKTLLEGKTYRATLNLEDPAAAACYDAYINVGHTIKTSFLERVLSQKPSERIMG